MVAIVRRLGLALVSPQDLEIDVLLGSSGLQHGIKTFPRPLEALAQLRDRDAVVRMAEALIGRLELPPERLGIQEEHQLLLLVEPSAEGLP
jgi:hypothetical protein